MITRTEALLLLKNHVKSDNMLKHCLASEAVMRAVARRLGRDEELWGLTALLHDLDSEITQNDMSKHALVAAEMLRNQLPEEALDAIIMHNEMASQKERSTEFQHALAASETITGLITATALVYPDKSLGSVKVKSITKRMKEKAFAASVRRENILECEQIGIPIDEFASISLSAMQEIHTDLGL